MLVKTNPVKAVIYLRISQDPNEDGLALDRQRKECEDIAHQRGWEIVKTYSDTVSASKRNVTRANYDQMFKDFKNGDFDALICWDLDRLTRQPRQLEDWIEAAEAGLLLVTGDGQVDLSTENGRMFARIKATVARTEIELKGKRQKAKNRQLISSGRPVPGRRRFGYKSDNMTPEPDDSKVVEKIFKDFDGGVSIYAISKTLGWRTGRVRETLSNRSYIGEVKHLGEYHHSEMVTPLIEVELFERAQIRLSDPTRKTTPGNEIKHLLSGLALCGVCGAKMFYRRGYICKENTSHAQIEKSFVENAVMWKSLEWAFMNQDQEHNSNGSDPLLKLIEKSIAIERKLNEAIDLRIELGVGTSSHLRNRISELSTEKQKIEQEILNERAASTYLDAINWIRDTWEARIPLDDYEAWKKTILEAEPQLQADEIGEGHYLFARRNALIHSEWENFWAEIDLNQKREFVNSVFSIVVNKGPRTTPNKVEISYKLD